MNLKTRLFLAYSVSGFALANSSTIRLSAASSPPKVLDLSMANLLIPFLLWTGFFAFLWIVISSKNQGFAWFLAIVTFGIAGLWWFFWSTLIFFDLGFQGRANEPSWIYLSLLVGVIAAIAGALVSAKFSQQWLHSFDRSTTFLWLMSLSFGGAVIGMVVAILW